MRPRKRVCAGIFLFATAALTVVIPAASADRHGQRATIRANDAHLSSAEHATLLELYSLETQLARARARGASAARRLGGAPTGRVAAARGDPPDRGGELGAELGRRAGRAPAAAARAVRRAVA